MLKQIQQQTSEEKIESLKFEIASIKEELEGVRQAKSDYLNELLNDRTAQERRLELLAAGHETVCEFSDEQLRKLNNFTNTIKELEARIVERHRTIEKAQTTIAAQHQLKVAENAIKPKIRKFNECLAQLREVWEELQAVATEHDIEFAEQALPGEAELEEKTQPGFENWLKIYFGD